MWSAFTQLLNRLFGRSQSSAGRMVFPVGVDKLAQEYTISEELEPMDGGATAREAYALAEGLIVSFDASARLFRIESRGRPDAGGSSIGWNFMFHLPERWGEARFEFDFSPSRERVTVRLKPFAASGSAMAKFVEDGQLGFVEQQWKVELERCPPLPASFQDSSEVLSRWVGSGNRIEQLPDTAILRAVTPPLGGARWEVCASPNDKKCLSSFPIE